MKKHLLKVSSLIACLGFLMSATKCDKQAAPEPRQLKKNVRIMEMNAPAFLDNSGFNFSETAQSQMSGVLNEKNYFFERNVYPVLNQEVNGKSSIGISKASLDQVKNWFPELKKQDIDLSQDSSCLITRPQHFISGKINALEAYSGNAVQFGFSESFVKLPLSVNFKMDKMRMDLSFKAFDPWTQQIVSAVNDEAFKKDYAASFGVDVGWFHIGPSFYRNTGLSEVTLAGLKSGIEKLAKNLLEKPNEEWSSRIMYARDNYVLILGGAELGIKNGDQFKIYNQVHNWVGSPCGDSSVLNGSTIVSDMQDPWIVVVEDAGNLMSKARVLNPKENSSINLGALVKLDQFVQPPPPPVKK